MANFSNSQGHFETPDQWLTRLQADVVLAFFGYNESFKGEEGSEKFRDELDDFVQHTLRQKYNGETAPRLVLVSPIAFQDLSHEFDLPDGTNENRNLELYTQIIKEVAEKNQVPFVDVFSETKIWFNKGEKLTIDGFQFNDLGYQKFSKLLVDRIFGGKHKADQTQK